MSGLQGFWFTGTVVRPPEQRANGPWRVTVLHEEYYSTNGEERSRKTFLTLAGFNGVGERIARLKHGQVVQASGKLSWSKWVDQNGVERSGLEGTALQLVVLQPQSVTRGEGPLQPAAPQVRAAAASGYHQGGSNGASTPGPPPSPEVGEDDIPF